VQNIITPSKKKKKQKRMINYLILPSIFFISNIQPMRRKSYYTGRKTCKKLQSDKDKKLFLILIKNYITSVIVRKACSKIFHNAIQKFRWHGSLQHVTIKYCLRLIVRNKEGFLTWLQTKFIIYYFIEWNIFPVRI
jgi:hypothetical protein